MTDAPEYDPTLIGPDGRLTRLHKGASAPPAPPPSPAPIRQDIGTGTEAAKRAKRRNGLADTILNGTAADETLGRKTFLGAGNPGQTPMYGGEL